MDSLNLPGVDSIYTYRLPKNWEVFTLARQGTDMFSEASSRHTETGSITYQVYARRKTRVTRGGSPGSSSRCESLNEAITDSKVLSFAVDFPVAARWGNIKSKMDLPSKPCTTR
jgi:hypothetical protein